MPTTSDDISHQSADLAGAEDSFLRTPLLADADSTIGRGVRQRGGNSTNISFSSRDVEQPQVPQTPSSSRGGGRTRRRILDRSGNFRQSRGRWGVDRQHSRAENAPRWLCCRRSMYREWGKDWFFRLAYQKTCVLFMLLFISYGLIIVFFGFIYLVSG
jgi:hypothetical protein